jgi:hypothetical protein
VLRAVAECFDEDQLDSATRVGRHQRVGDGL